MYVIHKYTYLSKDTSLKIIFILYVRLEKGQTKLMCLFSSVDKKKKTRDSILVYSCQIS